MSSFFEYGVLTVYFLSLTLLMVFGAHGFVMVYYYFKRWRATDTRIPQPLRTFPRVTIQLPVFNEYYVVERLIRAACAIDYPRHLFEIQVLDDSTDDTLEISRRCVTDMQREGFDISLIHRKNRAGYKAGALREGLANATGEFIAIFDADFVPPRDFLLRTLPYFEEAKTGLVQTRWGHLNPDYSLLTRAQAIGLDGHFVVEQAARNGAGFFMNFNGTAGIWRKDCIIDAGNWADDTLTEDLDLSYRAQLKGWKFKFLQDTVCFAELPSEIGALKSQQFRWTKGAIETAKKILPSLWRARLPLNVKLQGTVHLTNNMVFPFIVIVSLLNLPLVLIKNVGANDHSFYFAISSVFVIAFFGSFLMYLVSQKQIYGDWRRKILFFPVFMAGSMGLAINNTRAILEGVVNYRSAFQRTPKYRIESGRDRYEEKKYYQARIKKFGLYNSGILECLAALYIFAGILITGYYAEFAAIPFQMMFCFGYAYIGLLSVRHSLLPVLRAKFASAFWLSGRHKEALQSG